MTDRDRFISTMHYADRDRPPLCELSYWPETLERWREEGLPEQVDWRGYDDNETDGYFGLDRYRSYSGYNAYLCPAFDETVIEERGETFLLQQGDGVRVVRSKRMSSIPHAESRLLVDRASWASYYKPRLDPDRPERVPTDWDERRTVWLRHSPELPLVAEIGSLYGMLRNWMGIREISMLLYDDPALFEEMVETMADLAVSTVEKHVEEGVPLDACYLWEDMCYNSGPLISPEHVRKIILPHYRRITDACHRADVDIVCVDTDGKIDEILPIFLDAGINVVYPVEIGTTGQDPICLRARFGKDLRMMGGFDKRILAGSPEAIENEVRRLGPLVEEGGYIPMCDHYVPPNVSLSNYQYYRKCAADIWL